MLANICCIKMSFIIYMFTLTLSFALVFSDQRHFYEPVSGCETRNCAETVLNECAASGRAWAAYQVDGSTSCICCNYEQDAQLVAGGLHSPGVGFFYGNQQKVCENIRSDEGLCFSRQSRDCNYEPTFRGKEFIGCFYCRPRCDHDHDCEDLGRTCGVSKMDQPIRSCTGMGSGMIPGRDDYQSAIRKNYLVVVKVQQKYQPPQTTSVHRRIISTVPPPPPTPKPIRIPTVNGLSEKINGIVKVFTEGPNEGFIVVKNNHKGFDRTPSKDDNYNWPPKKV